MLSTAQKIRIARLLYRFTSFVRGVFGGGDLVQVRRHGIQWELDLREGIDLTIYLAGAFELDTLRCLERLVRKGATVVDVGANIGAHTLHLARLVGSDGRVFAFEPTAFAVEKLRANLRANPDLAARVQVRQAFLVSQTGERLVETVASSWPVDGRTPDDAQMGSLSMAVSGAESTTLDESMRSAGDPRVQLMKMDVDGHELEVLQGGRALLSRCRPAIVMELAPYVFHPKEKFDEVVRLLVELDYELFPLGSNVPLPREIAALRALIPANGSMNVVAVAKPRE